jgi:hypothetical protein
VHNTEILPGPIKNNAQMRHLPQRQSIIRQPFSAIKIGIGGADLSASIKVAAPLDRAGA